MTCSPPPTASSSWRKPPPPPQPTASAVDTTPTGILRRLPAPAGATLSRWFTEWRIDWLWLAFAVIATAAYLAGVPRQRLHWHKWPVTRTVSWLAGVLALVYITSGVPAVSGRVLCSAHWRT